VLTVEGAGEAETADLDHIPRGVTNNWHFPSPGSAIWLEEPMLLTEASYWSFPHQSLLNDTNELVRDLPQSAYSNDTPSSSSSIIIIHDWLNTVCCAPSRTGAAVVLWTIHDLMWSGPDRSEGRPSTVALQAEMSRL